MSQLPRKIHAYVDETGQDTEGKFFAVAIVIIEGEKDTWERRMEEVETASGRGTRKWQLSRPERRASYVKLLLSDFDMHMTILYKIYGSGFRYQERTGLAISAALQARVIDSSERIKAFVTVDGLQEKEGS